MSTVRPLARRARTLAGAAFAGGALLVAAGCSGVQGGSADADEGADFPTKPVEWTVPSDPGGSTDLISRAVAKAMEDPLGESVTVVNKPGANGAVGGKEVLGRDADGYSLVMLFQSLMAIGPLTIDDPDAIQMSDMDVVSGLTVEDYVLVTSSESGYKTLDDVLALDNVKFGTTGAGTGSELSQELLFADAGTEATNVPFDGGAPTVTAVLGNQVDVGSVSPAEAAPHLASGKMVALAVFAEERLESMPDLPTATELGHDVVVDQRRWVAAPKGLPDEVRTTLEEAVTAATEDEAYQQFLEDNYIGEWVVPGDEVVKQVDAATQNFADLIEKFDLKLSAG